MRIVFYFCILSVIFLQSLMGYSATLLAEYRMDEASWNGSANEVLDSSVNGKHGTALSSKMPPVNLAATYASGGQCKVGTFNLNAIDLTGLGVDTSAGAKTTVSFWVKWDGSNDVIPFGWFHYDLIFMDGNFGFNTAGGDLRGISSAGMANTWKHVVAVFTNKNISANLLYIDGVLQTTVSQLMGAYDNNVAEVQTYARIGGWHKDTNYLFTGYIDEVSIWRGELSSADITDIYNKQKKDGSNLNLDGTARACTAPSIDLTSKLKLEYRMDEATWSTATGEIKDSAGDVADLTTYQHGTAKGGATNVSNGQICKAAKLNGVNQYIDTEYNFSWTKNDKFTISAWIKPNASGQYMPIVAKGGDWEYTLMVIDDGRIAFNYWSYSGNDEMSIISSDSVTVGDWNHVVFTYEGPFTGADFASGKDINIKSRIYLNGENVRLGRFTGGQFDAAFKASSSKTSIGYGYAWGYKYFDGYIDEVKIYDGQALSYDEVKKLYELESDGKNLNDSTRNCSAVGASSAAKFNCVDVGGDWSSGTIKTKSSDAGFNLDVVALSDPNADGLGDGEDATHSGNITVSLGYATDTICSGWTPLLVGSTQSMSGARKTVSFAPLNKASKELRCRVEEGATVACSTDKFSVKPSGYELDKTEIKAEDFSLTVKAKNSSGTYDGTASLSTALATTNTACDKQSGFLAKKSGGGEPISLTFASDVSTNDLLASDIGAVTVTVKDSTWTAVDQPNDCGDSCDVKSDVDITIKPYSVKVSDADMSEWGYKSKNSSYKTKFSAKSSAVSKQGIVLKNFSKDCYADDVNVALKASTDGDLSDLNVAYSSAYTQATKKTYGYDFVIPKTDFSKGAKDFDLYLAWQKDNTKESNPQELNITTLTPSIGSASYDAYNADKNTTFLYGKFIFPSTVADFASTINVKGYKAFYSGADAVSIDGAAMSRVPGLKNWWINQKDIATSAIKAVISNPSDTLKDDNTTSKLGSASLISGAVGGEVVVSLSDVGNKTQKAILHFAVDDWLWTSAFNYGYSFAVGSDCAAHPCGYLDIFDTNTNVGWSGSDTRAIKSIPKSKRKSRIEW